MPKEVVSNSTYINQHPGAFPIEDPATILPGRRNLRISVTPRCKSPMPTLPQRRTTSAVDTKRENLDSYEMPVDMIGQLVMAAQDFGIKTVKLTGGDFGMYRHMEELFSKIAHDWQKDMAEVSWGRKHKWNSTNKSPQACNDNRISLD